MLLKITPIRPRMSAKKNCPNFLGGEFATGGHTVLRTNIKTEFQFPTDFRIVPFGLAYASGTNEKASDICVSGLEFYVTVPNGAAMLSQL